MSKILALNPFHGGSHKAFINGWIIRSSHDWNLLTLNGTLWKWRLQYAAVELAKKANDLWNKGNRWDAIFCTSMMNVADFRALTPELNDIPLIVYFHENQLTYPESDHMKFDLSLCMINIKSALVADKVWFNSDFHRCNFLNAAKKLLRSKPNSPVELIDEIYAKSSVQYQAIDDEFIQSPKQSFGDPIKIVWAARWELDKNPGLFFKALRHLKNFSIPFELYFLGEEMHTKLACIDQGRQEFADEIKIFGYAESREDYISVLKQADIFVSTANHEFFGIAAVEAVCAGCTPIVPNHQAYPEVLKGLANCFYKPGSAKQLAEQILKNLKSGKQQKSELMKPYYWSQRAKELDSGLTK